MKQDDFEFLENKILSDKEFAKTLADNPEKALMRVGISLTPEVFEAIKGLDGLAFEKLITGLKNDEARK